jgi:flagellar M-ring protein FliF
MQERLIAGKDRLLGYWNGFGKKKQRRIALLGIILLITLSMTGYLVGQTDYAVLYTDMESREVSEVLTTLQDMGVKAKVEDGSTVLVDSRSEEAVRMQLALQGYPRTGLNYDIYMDSMTFTTSSQDKKVMLIYQLQERLGKTIAMLDGINGAVVTISMEDDRVFRFTSEESSVSANVVLDIDRNTTLGNSQVTAIKRLMITSISGLREENVAIIDSNLNNLTGITASDNTYEAQNLYAMQREVERDISERVRYLFEPVFGNENIKVAVNATVDMDKRFTEVIEYSPVVDEEGIPYMVDELTERLQESSQNTGDAAANYQIDSETLNTRMQNVVNYRVNELRQVIEEAQGGIQEITVSVLINNTVNADEAILESINGLVAAAVGIQPENITVGYMNFAASEALRADMQSALADQGFQLPISERALLILFALVLSFILTLVILRQLKPASKKRPAMVASMEGVDVTIEDDEEALGISDTEKELMAKKKEIIEKFNKDSEGEKVIKEIETIIDTNPSNIANIISAWLNEDGF